MCPTPASEYERRGFRHLKTALKFTLAAASGRWVFLLAVMLLLAGSTAYALDDGHAPSAPSPYSDLKQTVEAALQAEKK
jgi:hypothetical protein